MPPGRSLYLGFFLWSWLAIYGQEPGPFRPGVLVDTVFLTGNTSESFALYLPESYDPEEPIPILFVFDPAARGGLGVKTFEKAAELYGWMVVGSNDSRNGPYERNFGQANRLFADVLSRFRVDEDHIYTTGFSGGARLATTLAVLTDHIRGVIACGAAFSPNPGQIPAPGATFAFAGMVGSKDMNYQEMEKAGQWLKKIEVTHRIFYFDGRHQWPPETQVRRAVSWMAFQTGVASPDSRPALYRHYFESERSHADSLFREGRYFESVRAYEAVIDQFGSRVAMDSVWKRISDIRSLAAYRKQEKVHRSLADQEAGLRKRFSDRFHKELDEGRAGGDFSWWKREKARIDARLTRSEMKEEQDLALRMDNFLFAMPFEASNRFRREKQLSKSRYCTRLLTALFPESAFVQVRLAEEYALVNKPEEMIEALQRAKDLGFSDAPAILENPLFAPYRTLKEFPFVYKGKER